MALKPWYIVVAPREDLRENQPLDASEFAVHLDQGCKQRGADRTNFPEKSGGIAIADRLLCVRAGPRSFRRFRSCHRMRYNSPPGKRHLHRRHPGAKRFSQLTFVRRANYQSLPRSPRGQCRRPSRWALWQPFYRGSSASRRGSRRGGGTCLAHPAASRPYGRTVSSPALISPSRCRCWCSCPSIQDPARLGWEPVVSSERYHLPVNAVPGAVVGRSP